MVTNYNHLLSISHEPGFVLRVCVSGRFSRVQLFETLWTVAHQNPLSMGFSRQEYWRGCHFLLHMIFPIQGSNLDLLNFSQTLDRLSHQGSPMLLMMTAKYDFLKCFNFFSLFPIGFL